MAESEERVSDWAEVHYAGSLVCEARYEDEDERWLLLSPPQAFLDELPMVVELKEMIVDRSSPAQLEQEFGQVYARVLPGELEDHDVPAEPDATPWEV